MTLDEARRIVRLAAEGADENIPTGKILRAACVLLAQIDRG